MKFQIESLITNEQSIHLSRPVPGRENIFTMLVGKNASGKSRALSKIANHYLFPHHKNNRSNFVYESGSSLYKPRRLIAVSNSRFDRFPSAEQVIKYGEKYNTEYHYLGLGQFGSSPYKILSKWCQSLFLDYRNDMSKKASLSWIFEYTGFLPIFSIELKRKFSRIHGYGSTIDSLYDEYQRATATMEEDTERKFDFEKDIIPALYYLNERVSDKTRTLSFRVDLRHDSWLDNESIEFARFAAPLLSCGILQVSGFHLYDISTKDKRTFFEASSGQQCMLLMFLGISSAISDESLICIDEPEISLHPRWQAEFIGIAQKAFSLHRGCHFLIATHSPQVVAGLTSDNGFVADLESNTLTHSSEYAKRSADFQLTEIFHEPGFKNEYLIRTLLVLIAKLSKEQSLSYEDAQKIKSIEYIKDRLESSDPVLHLLNQVKMLSR
ncbi:AAA family ATPase [Dechloromonas sp. ZY10]|uniref:ATP-binding protein n=1 Tax=Dechloromonas aquae TaxID=2664436 RepID=UPI0035279006